VLGLIATQNLVRANVHRMQIQRMAPDLLGAVPQRVDGDRDHPLRLAYAPIAAQLACALALPNQVCSHLCKPGHTSCQSLGAWRSNIDSPSTIEPHLHADSRQQVKEVQHACRVHAP
jgi:hypothetical protein